MQDFRKLGAHTAAGLLTFLLADIRGYTRFTSEHGDAASARLSELFLSVCREVVAAHGGTVFGSAGDQALAAFASARDALTAAVALQARLAEEQSRFPDLPLSAGIGVDAGEAISVAGDYRGGAVNLAARLCSIAGGGEIFASEGVIHLARKTPGIAFIDRGEVTLKGFPGAVRVLQIGREGSLPSELPPLQPILVTHPTNLPDVPTPFIGRQKEIASIIGLLHAPRVRLVTLTGPGGTGKTRLALQVGDTLLYDFQDGVFFCDLSPLADPSLIPSTIAQVLNVQEEGGRDPIETLSDALKGKQILLVLDNFEHLLDGTHWVARLLDACRDLHILVTSRIPLHLTREHEHLVPPLSVPDLKVVVTDVEILSQYESVALFIQRSKAARDSFVMTDDNAPAVAEICSRLDGLPLAIELAAARIKLFPPHALLNRLTNRLTLLTGGARDLPTRQQTLRGAVDWSYSLLSPDEQILFTRLSVFAGGCTFEAAEAVCNDDGSLDLLEGMASLVDKSLLRQEGTEEPRFTMLETIREYALDRLSTGGERDLLERQHADYFLALAEEVRGAAAHHTSGIAPQRFEEDHDNLRAALRFVLAHGPTLEMLPPARVAYLLQAARAAQQIYAHEDALALLHDAQRLVDTLPEGVARATLDLEIQTAVAASAVTQTGSYHTPQALHAYSRAQALCERLGKPISPPILRGLALVAIIHTRMDEALDLSRQLLDAAERDPTPMLQVEAHYIHGVTAFWLGQLHESRQHLEMAVAHYDSDEHWAHRLLYAWDPGVASLVRLGLVLWHLGYPDQARRRYEDALALAESLSHPFSLTYALNFGFWILTNLGDAAEAGAAVERLSMLTTERSISHFASAATIYRGYLRARSGDATRGIAQVVNGIESCEHSGERVYVPFGMGLLADAQLRTDRPGEALETAIRGLTLGVRFWDAEFYRLQAEAWMQQGDPTRAEPLLKRAKTIAREQGATSLMLRIAMSRCRLHRHSAGESEARGDLAAIHGEFREGFERQDLQLARALLDEIPVSAANALGMHS